MSPANHQAAIRLSDVVSALSIALDLTEGQPMGHSIRSCIIGMRIAEELQLPDYDRRDLYYALLLKDSGCSSNAARMHQIMGSDDLQSKSEVKFEDWTKPSLSGLRYLNRNVMPGAPFWRRAMRMLKLGLEQKRNNAELIGARCERGAEIARKIGLSENAAQAIHALDEHWNGGGYSEGRKGKDIPQLARIMNVSQTMEVFAFRSGPAEAVKVISDRSGRWFDPEIVRVARSLGYDQALWERLRASNAREFVLQMEPGVAVPASAERIDSLCEAFAQVIDAKSSYTFQHSVGVTDAAVDIAEGMALAPSMITMVRRAALLHDIGKLSVSNAILEKPGKLTDAEWKIMKMHPVYTRMILEKISGFEHLAFVAGAHHERLDGKGYPDGLSASQMTLPARIVAVADVFQALSEKRPYRDSLPTEVVMRMMETDVPHRLDAECVTVLKAKKALAGALPQRRAQSAHA
ncbi:MAG: HD domain-containing protein [Acidobacteriota bacterium]|nr:HD domain-containing protein [Acidobacteriota bacterium]